MRIQLISDVHTELHRDGGESFINAIDPDNLDVLVVAGDFCTTYSCPEALQYLCERFADKEVVYVPGNHEYYRHNWKITDDYFAQIANSNPNFHFLNDSSVTISGQRFIGGTLWFDQGQGRYKNRLSELGVSDFSAIQSFEPEVYSRNRATVLFLEKEIRPDDVVVTHHLPHPGSISPRYAGSPVNQCFLTDMSALIERVSPKLWLHGHTHSSIDYIAMGSNTRVVCNPFGYGFGAENPAYVETLILES